MVRILQSILAVAWVAIVLPSAAAAQSGAASVTGLVTDETGGGAARRDRDRHQPRQRRDLRGHRRTRPATTRCRRCRSAPTSSRPSSPGSARRRRPRDDARGPAGRAPRLQDGRRRRAGDRRGDRQPPILQTETATVGEVISGNTVQSLPLNGRNTGQLALLLPGTITYNPRGFTNIGSINMNRPFVNGNREQTNNFTVDGFDVNETIDNRVAYQPSPDALAEISVETNNYAADTGNVGGAVVANVIKSGTNQFRGNVFEFYRNSDFDANTWENNRSGAPKQERRQHIYGGTFGGPIARPAVLLRRLPGLAAGRAWLRHGVGGARGVAARRPVERGRGDPRPAHRPAVPRQPDPGRPHQPGRAGACSNDTANYPLPNRTVPGGVTGNFVGETLLKIRGHQGDVPRRLERVDQRQVLRALLVRHLRGRPRRQAVPAGVLHAQRPAVLERRRQLEPHLRADAWSTSCWSATATRSVLQRDLRLGGPRHRQRDATASPAASRSTG